MSMTVGQLLAELEGLDEDIEVRFASQPSYPLQYHIDQATVVFPEHDEDEPEDEQETATFVYLSEGGQVYDRPYLPGYVCEAIGW